jgi:UDP-3-O-[3-hydroxymyristoyl] N-acetylglucosamine deacetylase
MAAPIRREALSVYAQHTLAAPVSFQGVGLHTGQTISVTLLPAAVNTGIRFVRIDVEGPDPVVPARGEAVCQTRLGTVIGNGDGVTVSTVEHLMACLCGLEIDNLTIELDGPEVPIMDGSCEPFLAILDRAGRRPQQARRRYIEILDRIEVTEAGKSAALCPADAFEVAFEILFDTSAIGRQRVDLVVDETSFREDLAASRTFGFLCEVESLRAAGLARGGSLDTVVVIEGDTVLNPGGLRRGDEFVRHKALDAIGDLYLLGAPLLGRYEGLYAGHGLNNALVRALLDRPDAWRFAAPHEALARAV